MTETIQYDLFIVYADGDADWVERVLIPSLTVPSKKILTKEGFRPSVDKIAEYERAVRISRYSLLILSPAFFADMWARYGGAIASYSRVKSQSNHLLPLILHPCELPQNLDQIVSFDCTKEAYWQRQIERLCTFLNQSEAPLESVHCLSPAVESPNKLSSSQYSFSTFPQNIQQLVDKNKIKAALDQLEKHLVSIDEPDLQDDFIGLSIRYYRHQKEKDLLSQNILRLSQEITNRKMKLSLAPISLKMSLEENFDKSFETRHRLYSGKIKLRICKRLTHDWPDLADYLDIPLSVRKRFEPGREPQGVWEWLEERDRLNELPEALVEIDRHDLIKYFEEQ